MKATRLIAVTAIVAASAMSLAACGKKKDTTASSTTTPAASASAAPSAASVACATGKLSGTGSSFQGNIETQWIKDFDAKCSGATVDYQATNSGTGIQQFGAGQVDFGGSDATMKPSEQAAADKRCGAPALHIPVTAGGIALVYKLSGVNALNLSAATVADIYNGKVTKWNDPEIAADNSGVTLPATTIQAIYRNDSSGTTKIFTSWLNAAAPTKWTAAPTKDATFASSAHGVKGSANIATTVGASDGTIGYVEDSFAVANGLSVAKVKNGAGEYIAPDTAAVSAALGSATLPATGDDLKVKYDYANKVTGVYPVTGLSYVIVCSKGNKNVDLLKAYLTYATGAGQASAAELGYAPLPTAIATRVQSVVASLA